MNKFTERDILTQLRSLNDVEPGEQATRRALSVVQSSLREKHSRRHATRRRIIMSTSIAAGVVIIASLAWFSFAPQQATAAEALAHAAAATQAYKGWVHIQFHAPVDHPLHTKISWLHFDKTTGTTIRDNVAYFDHREIEMWDVPGRQELRYDSRTNEIQIGDLSESFARNWAAEMAHYPITVAETIEKFEAEKGAQQVKLVESKENGLKRIDVTFPEQPTTSATTQPTTRPSKATFWIDPKTDLIQKVQSDEKTDHWIVQYTYGNPIADIYALVVPRDAKVIDNRIKGDVNALFDRLQKRFEKGFGDYVAIASEMDVDHPDQPDREGAITVYAAAGEKYFNKRFLVGRKEYAPGQPRDVAIEPFQSWPPADCDLVLKRVKDALPSDFLIFDGKIAWQGYGASRKEYQSTPLTGRMSQTIDSRRAQQTLPGFVWPTRVRIGLFGSDAKASLITDPKNRPTQIGLHVEQMLFIRDMTQKQRATSTFWLDPARDDMPTEWNSATYAKDGKAIEYGSAVTFLDWRQSPVGAWYPVRWKSETTMSQDGKSVVSRQAMLLEMWPGKTLGDEWFTDPAKSLPK